MSKHEILIMFLGSVATYCFEMQRWALLKGDVRCFLILVLEKHAFCILHFFLILLLVSICSAWLLSDQNKKIDNHNYKRVINETRFILFADSLLHV